MSYSFLTYFLQLYSQNFTDFQAFRRRAWSAISATCYCSHIPAAFGKMWGWGHAGVVTGKMRCKSAGITVQGWVICGLEKCGLAAEYEAL